MPSTYTGAGIELIANGEQSGTWGDTTNDNLQIIDRLTSQAGSISLSGTTHTLTISDGTLSDGQYGILVFGGSPSGTNTVTISPSDAKRIFIVKNDSGESVVLTQGSGGNVTIPDGQSGIVYCDGGGASAAVADVSSMFNIALSNLATSTTDGDGDFFVVVDSSNNQYKLTKGNINISGFNNDSGFGVGTVTSVATGTGLTGGTITSSGTISHADTSSQGSVNNSGNTFIQDVTLDGFGHVTGLSSATVSVNDATITLSAGSGMTGGGDFTTNQSGNETITLSHADTSSQGSVDNSGNTFIQDITLDTYGHITAITSAAASGFAEYDADTSATGYFALPRGTTAQRPGSPQDGFVRFNTTEGYIEEYRNGSWSALSNVFTASGGTETDITVGGIDYKVHTFTSSGTFTVSSGSREIEYLVIAGGGGGSLSNAETGGGAGGAGGYRCSVSGENSGGGGSAETPLTLGPGSYTVTVGAGGADRASGSNSVFSSVTSLGGGRGGGFGQGGPASGGSGGGAAFSAAPAGSGTAGQGYAGGGNTTGGAGGGGGAGGVGAGASSESTGGNGGVGVSSSINGSATFRAGGGGGGTTDYYGGTPDPGDGGNGGGGNGSYTGNGSPGTANTGGGGGGPRGNGSSVGGAGGSGIVIIRYKV